MRRLRGGRSVERLLLPGVRPDGEGPGRLSEDCESWQHEVRPLVREKEVWLQEEMRWGRGPRGGRHPCINIVLGALRWWKAKI